MLCRASVTKTPAGPAHGVLTERKTGMEVLPNAAQLLRPKRAFGRSGDVTMVDAMLVAQHVVFSRVFVCSPCD